MKCCSIENPRKKLPTVADFRKNKIPSHVKEVWIHDRWGNLMNRCTVDLAVKYYRNYKVFNYYEKSEEIWELYIDKST